MRKITLWLLTNLFFVPLSLFSQNTFLDPTFGVNGIVIQNHTDPNTNVGLESDFGTIVLQPDGGFITASTFHLHGTDPRYIINRYDKNGILDPEFGSNGFVTSPLQHYVGGIELQSGGKIVGFATGGNSSYLFRYNTDGSPDTTFGNGGRVTDTENTIKAFSVRADGKIVVGKTSGNDGPASGFTMEQFDADGIHDTGFGDNGSVDFSVPQFNIVLSELIVQNNGKILVRGELRSVSPGDYRTDVFFVRFNHDGSLDTDFGEGGMKVFNFDDVDYAARILIQTDGKLVFSTSSYALTAIVGEVKRVIRLNSDGSFDTDFGTGGIMGIAYPIISLLTFKEEASGKLIAAGIYETSVNPGPGDNETPTGLVILRYGTNGDPDLDFGENGSIRTTMNFSRALNNKLLIQPNGKILVGATFCEAWMSCHPHSLVLRYDPDQGLSGTSFNKNHVFQFYPNPFNETAILDFTLSQSKTLSVDLYSADGRKITSLLKDRYFQAGFNSQQLDFPGTLAAGIYFLKLSGENETRSVRVIKK